MTNDFVLQLVVSNPGSPVLGLCSQTTLYDCAGTTSAAITASGYTTSGTEDLL